MFHLLSRITEFNELLYDILICPVSPVLYNVALSILAADGCSVHQGAVHPTAVIQKLRDAVKFALKNVLSNLVFREKTLKKLLRIYYIDFRLMFCVMVGYC